MARKSTGKRLRFEILKRDGFRCIYCGANPTQVLLRVDHVIPVASGGTSDPANLATSCHDCNAGKSSVPLESRRIPSTMDPAQQREHAEQIRAYLDAQREIVAAKDDARDAVLSRWEEMVGSIPANGAGVLMRAVKAHGFARVCDAIAVVADKGIASPTGCIKYFCGIVRNWREPAPSCKSPESIEAEWVGAMFVLDELWFDGVGEPYPDGIASVLRPALARMSMGNAISCIRRATDRIEHDGSVDDAIEMFLSDVAAFVASTPERTRN